MMGSTNLLSNFFASFLHPDHILDHQGGGRPAAVAAGLFQETSADIGLSPKTRTVSVQNPSHGQQVAPGLLKESDLNLWFI